MSVLRNFVNGGQGFSNSVLLSACIFLDGTQALIITRPLMTVQDPPTPALLFEALCGKPKPQVPSGTPRKFKRSDRPVQAMVGIAAGMIMGDNTVETDVKIILIT